MRKRDSSVIKVLVINTVGFWYEGITSVILNYVSYMNRCGMEISFMACNEVEASLSETLELHGNIINVSNRKENTLKYISDLNHVLRDKYDIVHIHGNSSTMAIESILAKMHHIPKIIVHNHNSVCSNPTLNKILYPFLRASATNYIACSKKAGTWLYKDVDFIVLNNAIDIKKFAYNGKFRKEVRSFYKIDDDNIIIGHIGNFVEQKNHCFLLDIFEEYKKINERSKLILLGDGELFQNIRHKVKENGLSDQVIFAGRRGDAYKFYSAMDIFLLPSLWEGLPVVMLEAQAAGLPLLASNNITDEAKCTDRTQYKSLSDGAAEWAKALEEIKNIGQDRLIEVQDQIRDHGFDIEFEAEKLRQIYVS